ncbi:hypothetical protein JTB14_021822 [Gonioctena quinquepunctata]|nr:hypothetical protein JTB14_021822 [Gonioctena quinquepunctata]
MQNEVQVPVETESENSSDKISEIVGEVDSSRENGVRRSSRVKKSVVMEDFVTFYAFEIAELSDPLSAEEISSRSDSFLWEKIAQGFLDLRYLRTEEMLADIFTKPVNGAKHFKCLEEIGHGM